jgi:hypothetical protein
MLLILNIKYRIQIIHVTHIHKAFLAISRSPNKTERVELAANGYAVYLYIGDSMADDFGIDEKEARVRCEGVRFLYMRTSKKIS